MPYVPNKKRSSRKARKTIDIRQNKFPKAYISTIDDSRRPQDSLSDMTNIELVQDNVVRPRPPLVAYGDQPELTVMGRGDFKQDGERYNLWAMDDSGTVKLYKQKDGGAFTLLGGSYDNSAEWLSCVQNRGNVYIYNSIDKLSYVDLSDNSVNTYSSISSPTISSVTYTGTAGSETHYYRVSANNEVGESIASTAVSDNAAKPRDNWVENTDYIDITWGSVTGATSYTVYYSSDNISFYELYSTTALTFKDLGTIAYNPYKLAPEGNSTDGPIFNWMYVDTKNSQVFGITNDNKLYWSATGASATTANFSPYDGGGYVPIDEDGDTTLNYVTGFRNGKGDPVVTVSARAAAGKGKLYHISFESLTVGDQVIIYPNVYEANGQTGTYAPRATIKSTDDLVYPTGRDFKSTGTSQNIVNILTTRSISQVINDVDVPNISLASLHKAVGVEDQDRLYFALPVGSTSNNEIWYLDRSRKNAWILRWTVAAMDLWLYEDNSGSTHFCALVNNRILEFTRTGAQPHQDDGTAWRSRAAFSTLVWDDGGYIMGKIRRQYVKLLYPKGTVTANTTGLDRNGVITSTGSDSYTVTTTPTGWGIWQYGTHQYGEDPGAVNTYGKSVAILEIKPKGLVNQLTWEVVANTQGSDYILSGVRTKGFALDDQVLRA